MSGHIAPTADAASYEKRIQNMYIELTRHCRANTKVFVQDMGAPGLTQKKAGQHVRHVDARRKTGDV